MNCSTWNAMVNSAEIDFDTYTLADAIDLAEFIEDINDWEEEG